MERYMNKTGNSTIDEYIDKRDELVNLYRRGKNVSQKKDALINEIDDLIQETFDEETRN
jgi:hypothetical protein